MVENLAGIGEVIAWREQVIRAALDVLSAERALSDEAASATVLTDAEDRLALAARGLARSVDQLVPGRKPKGWADS